MEQPIKEEENKEKTGKNVEKRMTSETYSTWEIHEFTRRISYEDVLSGTSVNPIRRSSITNAAICSSLAPSLVGACEGVPSTLLPSKKDHLDHKNGVVRQEGPENSCECRKNSFGANEEAEIATNSHQDGTAGEIVSTDAEKLKRKKSKSELRLRIIGENASEITTANWNEVDVDCHQHHHHFHHHHHRHHIFPHIHVPVLAFTAPASDGSGRKFNFGIRKHSQTAEVKWNSINSLIRWLHA